VHSAGISVTQGRICVSFAPQGRHVALIGAKFGVEESTNWGKITPNFTPIGARVGPIKLKIVPKFRHINAPQGRLYPLGDFYQIFIICRQLHVRSGIKIWTNSVKEFLGFGG